MRLRLMMGLPYGLALLAVLPAAVAQQAEPPPTTANSESPTGTAVPTTNSASAAGTVPAVPTANNQSTGSAPRGPTVAGESTARSGPAAPTESAALPAGSTQVPAADEASPPRPPDPALEAELARELGALSAPSVAAPKQRSTAPGEAGAATSLGLGNASNPAMSATFAVLAGVSSLRTGGEGPGALISGIHLQEAELRLSSVVDPYFRADVVLAGDVEGVGFEQATVSTLQLPWVTLVAGQAIARFGRHNAFHLHSFPFLTAPLPWRALLGEEGLRDPGVIADVLLPLPVFVEASFGAYAGEWEPFAGEVPDDPVTAGDDSVPDRRNPEDLVYQGRLHTLVELGKSTTFQLGGSYLGGRNGFGDASHVVGGDLTVKWRPIDAERYTGLDWTSEWLWTERNGAPGERRQGAYSSLAYQFLQRYWLQGRGALLGRERSERILRGEALFAFVPSEFSVLRLQYAIEDRPTGGDPVHELFVQLGASIGAHPAHAY